MGKESKAKKKEAWNWEWRKALQAEKDEKAGTKGDAAHPDSEFHEELGGGGGDQETRFQYPLICNSEIPKTYETEMMDTIMSAVDRYPGELAKACEYIKEEMDRLYEPLWHCIIGENFGFDVSYDENSMMYMFYNGNLAILVWKVVVF